MSQPMGSLIDSMGVTHEPEDGELVASAFVLLRVITADGREVVRHCQSDGLSWVEKIGLLRIAERSLLDEIGEDGEDAE